MKLNSKPALYGLIGYRLKHSLSPLMHNAAFNALKINAQYKLFPLREDELADFMRSLHLNNICGLNVTVPYKEKVMPILDSLSKEAKLIGAINTIKVYADRLEGFNTDGDGFLRHIMQDLRFNPRNRTMSIIGAGGASRAISVYLSREKPRRIAIHDIDKAKLISLVSHLKENFRDVDYNAAGSIAELNIKECDLLINATSVGMKESDGCLVDEKELHKDMLVYDLIYNPPETALLAAAKRKGVQMSNGLGMLLYQGARSFEIWTGKRAPLDVMRKALLNEAKR